MPCSHKYLEIWGTCRDCGEAVFDSDYKSDVQHCYKFTFDEFYSELRTLLRKAAKSGIAVDHIGVMNSVTLGGDVTIMDIEVTMSRKGGYE